MLKDTFKHNENVKVNTKEMEALKEHFPQCFDKNGNFDMAIFEELVKTKDISIKKEGYALNFLGKSYARYLSNLESETVIVPDESNKANPSENIYIVGDNLDALQHLKHSYAGEIKCVYIDPPYNTGSDGFVYNDKFEFSAKDLAEKIGIEEDEAERILNMQGKSTHSAWLTFMYPRLELAKELLADDGVIFISIDDNEQANCKLLCDAVFGEGNFLTCITRATGTPTGGGFDGLVNEMDYIFVYSKNIVQAVINGLEMNEDDATIYDQIDENGKRYLTRSLRRTGGEDRREDRPTMFYPLIAPDGSEIYPYGPTGYESRWICAPETAQQLEDNNLIEWKQVMRQGQLVWHPYQKFYLDNRTKKPGNIWKDIFVNDDISGYLWDDIEGNKKATREIRSLFDDKKVFETAKPVDLIKRIISIGSKDNDLILDFFGGSSTTAHAILDINVYKDGKRKYILVQLDEPVKQGSEAEKAGYKTIDEIGRERIRRAAVKIRADEPEKSKGVDLGFKTYYLKIPEKHTLDKIESFNPEFPVDGDDIIAAFGKDTVLATWAIKDGYGFNTPINEIDLKGHTAYFINDGIHGANLYILDEISEPSIMELVRRLEANELVVDKIIVYGYALSFTASTSLRTNLKTLKNRTPIDVAIRY